MLVDDLEELKRETPEGLSIQRGSCKYCRQMAQIQTLIPWDDDTCNEAATELCDCYESKEYTRKKQQKENALKAIEKQFGSKAGENEINNEVVQMLKEVVNLIVQDLIDSVTIDIGNGLKAKISLTAKGCIKVDRTKTIKASMEA